MENVDAKTQRQTGRQAQLSNITAARAVSDIIRTTLGPRSMLKVSMNEPIKKFYKKLSRFKLLSYFLLHHPSIYALSFSVCSYVRVDVTRSNGWSCDYQ